MSRDPDLQPASDLLAIRYQQAAGEVQLTGIQALVRLVLEARRSDDRTGLRTASYVSGYEGAIVGHDQYANLLLAGVRCGRLAVADPARFAEAECGHGPTRARGERSLTALAREHLGQDAPEDLLELVGHRAGDLVSYQHRLYAIRALGMKHKVTFGPWFRHVFRLLTALRRLRGTPLDVFGYTKLRRIERLLAAEYLQEVDLAAVTRCAGGIPARPTGGSPCRRARGGRRTGTARAARP